MSNQTRESARRVLDKMVENQAQKQRLVNLWALMNIQDIMDNETVEIKPELEELLRRWLQNEQNNQYSQLLSHISGGLR